MPTLTAAIQSPVDAIAAMIEPALDAVTTTIEAIGQREPPVTLRA